MITLPAGFPMYCIDLKQMLDQKAGSYSAATYGSISFDEQLKLFKSSHQYPKQENEHNALDDARWNKALHEFIAKL